MEARHMRITIDLPDEVVDVARTALARGRQAHLTPPNTFIAGQVLPEPEGDDRPPIDELLEDFVVSVAEGERSRLAGQAVRQQVEQHREGRRGRSKG
jgi:hypothetical protein